MGLESGRDGARSRNLVISNQQRTFTERYQQFVASLASAGVLTAVAARMDPALVETSLGKRRIADWKAIACIHRLHWGPINPILCAASEDLERRG